MTSPIHKKISSISTLDIDEALEFASKPASTFFLAKIPLSKISIKDEMHHRAELKQNVVSAYARGISAWGPKSALDVFDVDGEMILVDGFHRAAAYAKAGVSDVVVKIRKGSAKDATLFSILANREHGYRQSKDDRDKAIAAYSKIKNKEHAESSVRK
jgi:hypothetical protein